MVFYRILKRVPGGEGVQVFVGVVAFLGMAIAPVAYKKTKAGHDYFSSEKPQEVEIAMAKKQQAKYASVVEKRT